MTQYAEIAQTFLREQNPQEMKRLTSTGKLNQFLQDIQEMFSEQEQEIIEQMSQNLPSEYLPRMKSLEAAKRVAREQSLADLGEFLHSL